MVTVVEKSDLHRGEFETHLYYDEQFVQERFNLPKSFFLEETILLIFYCLRDKRFRQIAFLIYKLIKQAKRDPKNAPQFLLNTFLELDSTFIKIGQFLSSRIDLLPKEYVDALSELQDSLPPLPFNEIQQIIEKELRKPIDKVFKYIDQNPIASASIGQVHKAELLNGIQVALKIQRPDLSNLFYQDLAILRCLALYFERYTEIGKGREWVQIIDEIGKTLFEEIDFIQEGKNADRFRKNLKYEERIYIPKIFWQYTTRKLITIEYVPGIKITDIDSLKQNNLNPKELSQVLVKAYFKQFFEDGFYHADPHPGNIVVKNDGTIVFYDFGMVARINEGIRAEISNVLVSIIGNDTDSLIGTLKKLELIKSDADVTPLKRVIEQAAYKYYSGEKLSDIDLNGIEGDLKELFDKKPMKLPSKFTYTLRMTGALEGVCRTLDPDFSLIEVAKNYFQDWIKENLPESKWILLKSIFPNQSKIIDKIKIYVDVIRDLPKYVSNIEKGNVETLHRTSLQDKDETNRKNEIILEEINEAQLKLKMAYSLIFLLCFVFIGSFLIQSENHISNILGFVLLLSSLGGSIGIVGYSIINKKVVE